MARVYTLTIEWRPVRRQPGVMAAEFILDGRSLLHHCEAATRQTFDLVSPFGWTRPDHHLALANGLLLRQPSLLASGRHQLLVCPECGHIGCGGITAAVRLEKGYFIWEQLGYENDLDLPQLFPMGSIALAEKDVAGLLSRYVPGLTKT